VQIRQRHDRLRRDLPVLDQDAELATAGRDDLAADEHVIAQVDELLPAFQGLLTDLRERDHHLDAGPVAGLQRREAELARVAGVHDAPRQPDGDAGGGVGLEVAPLGPHLGDRVRDRHRNRIRIADLGEEPVALGEADGLLFGDVDLGFGRLLLVAHVRLSSGRSGRCR
jgi:hypothetical protein